MLLLFSIFFLYFSCKICVTPFSAFYTSHFAPPPPPETVVELSCYNNNKNTITHTRNITCTVRQPTDDHFFSFVAAAASAAAADISCYLFWGTPVSSPNNALLTTLIYALFYSLTRFTRNFLFLFSFTSL